MSEQSMRVRHAEPTTLTRRQIFRTWVSKNNLYVNHGLRTDVFNYQEVHCILH
jgi:hypothetical protein